MRGMRERLRERKRELKGEPKDEHKDEHKGGHKGGQKLDQYGSNAREIIEEMAAHDPFWEYKPAPPGLIIPPIQKFERTIDLDLSTPSSSGSSNSAAKGLSFPWLHNTQHYQNRKQQNHVAYREYLQRLKHDAEFDRWHREYKAGLEASVASPTKAAPSPPTRAAPPLPTTRVFLSPRRTASPGTVERVEKWRAAVRPGSPSKPASAISDEQKSSDPSNVSQSPDADDKTEEVTDILKKMGVAPMPQVVLRSEQDALRERWGLPPITLRKREWDGRRHPHHIYDWDTKKFLCDGDHEPFCAICESPCCIVKQWTLRLLDPEWPVELKEKLQKDLDAIDADKLRATDRWERMMVCHTCKRYVCPDCAGRCMEPECGKTFCKDCGDPDPWKYCDCTYEPDYWERMFGHRRE